MVRKVFLLIFPLLTATLLDAGSITLVLTGDIMLGTTFPHPFLPPDRGRNLFNEALPILKSGDIIFGNLEETLNDNCLCVKKVKKGKVYAFRSPVTFVVTLKEAGYNILSLANNHTFDFGECGLKETENTLKKVGIQFATKDEKIATFNIRGIKIALMAVSFGPPPGSILYPEEILKRVKELSDKYDILLISVHNGREGLSALHVKDEEEIFYGEDRGNIYRFAHRAIDAGADLIIGHGPHVPRGMEVYRKRLIIYSLGNFCTYGWIALKKEEGLAPVVRVELDRDGKFIKGRIFSFIQKPPGGPVTDSEQRALKLIEQLSKEDFGEKAPAFNNDGEFYPPSLQKEN